MNSSQLSRRNSLCSGLLGLLLLSAAENARATERDQTVPNAIFAAQTLPSPESRLAAVTPEPETELRAGTAVEPVLSAGTAVEPVPSAGTAAEPVLAPVTAPAAARATVSSSPLPDLDAGELFPAEAFADATDQPGCSTVASLAEGLLGTCLRRGLSTAEQTLTQRLLFSAAQPNRTDAWSRDTESLFRLAQCAGALSEQRLVASAALAAADAELQTATPAPPAPPLSESRRERAQRAQWLWTYRLATMDVAQGNYLRATATLFRLHRTAPTRNLLSRITAARRLLRELHLSELH